MDKCHICNDDPQRMQFCSNGKHLVAPEGYVYKDGKLVPIKTLTKIEKG